MPGESCLDVAATVRADGFAFVEAALAEPLLLRCGGLSDWRAFSESWNDLGQDHYLAAVGRHRRRRHAVFHLGAGGFELQPHGPHYQHIQYNPLQGSIQRWFEPMEARVCGSESMLTILAFAAKTFGELAPTTREWKIEAHQFRIEAAPGRVGEPTPEGSHRDGVDYVLVLMVDRHNIRSGTTTIHAAGVELGHFTLRRPLDMAVVDDAKVFHGVTAVEPVDPAAAAHRDVLVVTFLALDKVGQN